MSTAVESRTYDRWNSAVFCKTNEKFGGLSNMAPGFLLRVNGVNILTSEALYQACRFPKNPDVQRLIIEQKSPMTAKMKSKPHRSKTREDWDAIRTRVMRWCLRVKLAQNWVSFRELLLSTGDLPIVEESRKDEFWGAFAQEDGTLVGRNVLGRLLMELREELKKPNCEALKRVEPIPIPDFNLNGEPIQAVQAWRMPAEPVIDPDLATAEATLWNASSTPMPAEAPASLSVERQPATSVIDLPLPRTKESPTQDATNESTPLVRRLIEVDLPIARISAHARREKSIRHGHISTLHIWWARRPLAACRAVICAALWPDPADPLCPQSFRDAAASHLVAFAKRAYPLGISTEMRQLQATASAESLSRWEVFAKNDPPLDPSDPAHQNVLRFALLDFIADFANWDNSTVPAYLVTSRALTQAAHEALGGEPGTRPLVVDPFAGGGSIPLEALRVGADAFASDLNPVAVLLNKVVLEYIPKYGQKLADEVRRWGKWVKDQAEQELAKFYPKDPDGATPIAYLWARTITCEGTGCGAEVPLLRSLWLAKKANSSVALRIVPNSNTMRVDFEIVNGAKMKDVSAGTVKRGSATCPFCGYTTPVDHVRTQLHARQGGTVDARLYCKVVSATSGTEYRSPTNSDYHALSSVKEALSEMEITGFNVSKEKLPPDGALGFRVQKYGISLWEQLFIPRQQLMLLKLGSEILSLRKGQIEDDALHTLVPLLALTLSKMAGFSSSLCVWRNVRSCVAQTFGRQTLSMVWDFGEMNPFAQSAGDFGEGVEYLSKLVDHITRSIPRTGLAQAADAADCPLPNAAASILFTDPPYYDAIPYGHLSGFFLTWLKLVGIVEEGDTESVRRQSAECIVDDGLGKHKAFFERTMTRCLREGLRICTPQAVGVVVFAHKSTTGWEAQLQAMLDAGWNVTASWPIDTERSGRLRAYESAALASSVHLVCRPRLGEPLGDWRDVLSELPQRMHEWMPRLASEGVVGADAIFACLGPALEIFSRYSRVEKANGDQVPLKEYLEHVWAAVSKEALSTIFRDADASGLEPDARLTAMWLWTIGGGTPVTNGKLSNEVEAEDEESEAEEEGGGKPAKASGFILEFDAARKIAQGLGIHLEKSDSFVEVKGDKARLLAVAERTKHLFGKDTESGPTGSKKAKKPRQRSLFEELEETEQAEGGWKELKGPPPGTTALDRLHQAMILFGAQRSELLKRFLVEDGVGKDARFWKLAQSLAALYPTGTDERRWVEGVLARKKGLGL
jgi:putative DNA methylase